MTRKKTATQKAALRVSEEIHETLLDLRDTLTQLAQQLGSGDRRNAISTLDEVRAHIYQLQVDIQAWEPHHQSPRKAN